MSPAPEYIVPSMKLTFSKLDTYSKCPLRFRLRYQQKLPDAPRGGRNISLILHKTLESFLYKARRDSSLETLLRAYENRCAPPQTPAQQRRFEAGYRALEAFHWREGHRLATAVALEQSFSVREKGVEVTGRLDCALETEAGLELIDFKFTSQVPQDPDPLQLQLYSWGTGGIFRGVDVGAELAVGNRGVVEAASRIAHRVLGDLARKLSADGFHRLSPWSA